MHFKATAIKVYFVFQFANAGAILPKHVEWGNKFGGVYQQWMSFNWGILRLSGPDSVKAILNTAGN